MTLESPRQRLKDVADELSPLEPRFDVDEQRRSSRNRKIALVGSAAAASFISLWALIRRMCDDPSYAHYAVAWWTVQKIRLRKHPFEHVYPMHPSEEHPEVSESSLANIENPSLQLIDGIKYDNLYITFGGNAQLNPTSRTFTIPEDLRNFRKGEWGEVFVRQAAFKYVCNRPSTHNWLDDTAYDIERIVEQMNKTHSISLVVCVGISLGGLAASMFARKCVHAYKRPLQFIYVGERTLNSTMEAVEAISQNLKYGVHNLSYVFKHACSVAKRTENEFFKTVQSNLQNATDHANTLTRCRVYAGLIKGDTDSKEDFLAGSTINLEAWMQESTLPCAIYTINGDHLQHDPNSISQIVLHFLSSSSSGNAGCYNKKVKNNPPEPQTTGCLY